MGSSLVEPWLSGMKAGMTLVDAEAVSSRLKQPKADGGKGSVRMGALVRI